MYYRSSLSVVTLRQYLKELSLFLNLEYRKYPVFRSYLLHALTYWGEILHMTLFYCTTDQVQVSLLYTSLAVRPSIHFLYLPPLCIDKFSWILKFDVGFFNAFLLEKSYIKIAFLNVHDGRIMHRLRCSGIFEGVMPILWA